MLGLMGCMMICHLGVTQKSPEQYTAHQYIIYNLYNMLKLTLCQWGLCWASSTSGDEDERQWVDLLNWAMQKSRAFHIEVVAELLFNVRPRFTPPTRIFNYVFHVKNIHTYNITLCIKLCTYYNTIIEQQGANTFNFSWSGRFADSNKFYRALHTPR
jgi:hypothetical protein